MDAIYKGILETLYHNCRTSYETLSKRLQVSATAIQRRVSRLLEKGVIERFLVSLSFASAETNPFLGVIGSNRSLDDNTFIEQIGTHPMVDLVRFDSYGYSVVQGEYSRTRQLSEMRSFLQKLQGVDSVELHPYPIPNRGRKVQLSVFERGVLRPLLDNPRTPIQEIAKIIKSTSKRVSRTIQKLIRGEGVKFTALYNLSAADSTYIVLRLKWAGNIIAPEEIINQTQQLFPLEFWDATYSAIQNLMWIEFNVGHPRVAEDIAKSLREVSGITIVATIIPYPGKRFMGIREAKLREIVMKPSI
ncbi:MAG: Lrp/AsnC family transcriptional regulator [Promethearchaeota archaeon]